mgnify:CR=1 FL=1
MLLLLHGKKLVEVVKLFISDGKELKVNDGNTWIQIQPVGKVLDITSNNTETEE